MKVKSLSRVRLLATPWPAAYQAPPAMGFSRQEYWSGCQCLLRDTSRLLVKLLISRGGWGGIEFGVRFPQIPPLKTNHNKYVTNAFQTSLCICTKGLIEIILERYFNTSFNLILLVFNQQRKTETNSYTLIKYLTQKLIILKRIL